LFRIIALLAGVEFTGGEIGLGPVGKPVSPGAPKFVCKLGIPPWKEDNPPVGMFIGPASLDVTRAPKIITWSRPKYFI
jgi:hypothetical protein